jgi:hypothetical protein
VRRLVEGLPAFVLLVAPFLLGLRAHNLLNEVYGTHRDLHPVLGSAALFWLIPVISLVASGALWDRVSRQWGITGKARTRVEGIALCVTGVWWVADLLWIVVMGLAATAPDSGGPSAREQLRFALFFGVPAAVASIVCAHILSARAPKGHQLWRLSLAGLGATAVLMLPAVDMALARMDLFVALRHFRRADEDLDATRHVCAVLSVLAKSPRVLDGVVRELEQVLRSDPSRASEVLDGLGCWSLRQRPLARTALGAMAADGELPVAVRVAAVTLLEGWLDDEDLLKTLLRNDSVDVRRSVVGLVEKRLQAIDRLPKNPEGGRNGSPSLERLEDPGVVVLQIAKRDPEPVVRGPALIMLGRLGDANAYAEAAALARAADGATCAHAFSPNTALGSEDTGYDHVLEAVVANSNCSEIADRARGVLRARAEATSLRHAVTARDQVCQGGASANEALAVVRRLARESPQAARSLVANLNCPGSRQLLLEVSRALDLPPKVRLAASFDAAGPPRDLFLLFLADNDAGLRRHAIDSLVNAYATSKEDRERLWALHALQERGLKDPDEANRRALCIGLERSFVPHEDEVVRLKTIIHDQCQTMGLLQEPPP